MTTWHFIDDNATFRLADPDQTSYLYFPLLNESGLVSAVTPALHGDVKTGQNSFLTPPVSVEDLHISRAGRNFWVEIAGYGPWSATGNSARQIAGRFDGAEPVELTAGLLWHMVRRTATAVGLQATLTSFVPANEDPVELLGVELRNVGAAPLTLTPTAAIPLYGRSADNLRDHRHVTALLHRIRLYQHGPLVRPTLSFDERGHRPNRLTYAVLAADGDGAPPERFFPVLGAFVGEGGTLDWPAAIVQPDYGRRVSQPAGAAIDGYEALGGCRFPTITLPPGAAQRYVIILAILDEGEEPAALLARYGDAGRFDHWLGRTQAHWQSKLATFAVQTADPRFDQWVKWVALQPTLRRLAGNSFLPYHDYGRGGRGWRDLWQDLLALLMMETGDVRPLLLSNFAGIRLDGSNATIIGSAPGEFKADRNNIPRVWMDHGAWPLLTTQLYIDATGDLAFLLQPQGYFRDAFVDRATAVDDSWQPEDGTELKTAGGEHYQGSVLEHLLIQHLTAFFNVGEHNIIRLEGADWNDGLDMAPNRGESVAFTALYASNLRLLAELVRSLDRLGIGKVDLLAECWLLLDTLSGPADYDDDAAKRAHLAAYFDAIRQPISGAQRTISLADLASDLLAKANWLTGHLRRQEWIADGDRGWFNGYYDDDGERVEGLVRADGRPFANGPRMTLTGQVFTLMGGIADDEQAAAIARAADHYLYAAAVGGYRLNTDFGEVLLNLGRCFGFAFGHKENGAMFSHMAVMYANALYRRGLVEAGFRVLDGLYQHCQKYPVSRMYPGLPEYVEPDGRGVYPYLTGSASWYLLTLLTEVFGVRGRLGDLGLRPQLTPAQFDERGKAAVTTLFAGRRLRIIYHNPARLAAGSYAIAGIERDGAAVAYEMVDETAVIPRAAVSSWPEADVISLDVHLAPASNNPISATR